MKNLLISLLCPQNTFSHRSGFMVFGGFLFQSAKIHLIPNVLFCKSWCKYISVDKAFIILPSDIRNTCSLTSKYFPEFFWLCSLKLAYMDWKHGLADLTVTLWGELWGLSLDCAQTVVWTSLSIFGLSEGGLLSQAACPGSGPFFPPAPAHIYP